MFYPRNFHSFSWNVPKHPKVKLGKYCFRVETLFSTAYFLLNKFLDRSAEAETLGMPYLLLA